MSASTKWRAIKRKKKQAAEDEDITIAPKCSLAEFTKIVTQLEYGAMEAADASKYKEGKG